MKCIVSFSIVYTFAIIFILVLQTCHISYTNVSISDANVYIFETK